MVLTDQGANAPGLQWISWTPPPRRVIKANFDAEIWEDGQVTIGCVLRDNTGKLLLIAGFLGCSNVVNEAELGGAWEAIKLTGEYFPGFLLWLEGGAISVIQDLKGTSATNRPSVILEDARWLFITLEVFRISHTYREGNQCADWFTK